METVKEGLYIKFIHAYINLYSKGFRRTAKFMYWINRMALSCDIPPTVKVGKNFQLKHYGLGVVIHPYAVIKDNVTIYQQVTLGSRYRKPSYITIEDGATLGAGCKIMGGVEPLTIGKNAQIGANAVVLTSVPAGATAVGVPAKIIHR